jgi:hypothetical protein
VEGDGPSGSLDRGEAGAGHFSGLDQVLDEAEAAGIGEGIEDVLEEELIWAGMVDLGHGRVVPLVNN